MKAPSLFADTLLHCALGAIGVALAALVLCLLCCRAGQAGAWVIVLGAAGYLYVLAGLALPALAADPPPSRIRKAICVVTLGSLVASLSPLLPAGIAAPLCAGA